MSKTFGKIIAAGDDTFIALVRQALDEAKNGVPLPAPFETLPPRTFTISQHSAAEMVTAGAIIPGSKDAAHPNGIAAYGQVFDRNDLWLNARVARNQPHLARHVVRHEIAHTLPVGPYRKGKLLPLMYKPDGSHPTTWLVGNYIMRPEECRADTLAEAVSGIDSPWDEFRYYGLDVKEATFPQFVAIHFEQPPAPEPAPVPEPEPVPLPLPDPRLVELEGQRDQLTAALQAVQKDRDDALNRIARKDAAMKEGLNA